jgi:preprotein translocase subunit SecD
MSLSNRWRWFIIAFTFFGSIIYVLPTFVNVGPNWILAKDKIKYGLDIQGGLQLVMGVDVENVVNERVKRTAGSLKKDLEERGVLVEEPTINNINEIVVPTSGGEVTQKAADIIEKDYGTLLSVVSKADKVLTLRLLETRVIEMKKQVVEQAIEVIRNRIDEFGVSEPNISAQGTDRILVQLPGIQDATQAKDLINRTALLQFRPVYNKGEFAGGAAQGKLADMVSKAEKAGNYGLGKDGLKYTDYVQRINKDLAGELPANSKIVFGKAESAVDIQAGRVPYLVETDNDLSGADLEDASVRPDQYGNPEVNMSFGSEGRKKFSDMTEKNVGNQVAIILDEVLQSAPQVKSKIPNGQAVITLGQNNYQETLKEAQFIATTLRAGALPAALEQLEERTVGPSLGSDAIASAQFAGIVGISLVFLFMLFYYRTLGLVANITLLFNVLIILAALSGLGATLTLPGIAGIVLTVGMAVDSNIIIFERLREEIRKGASASAAVRDGFSNAFSAIFDSQITTAAACVILMYFGTGPVRGFGVTLLVGVIASLFTAVFVCRSLVDVLVHKFKMQKLIS